jgi:hypothetical protein
VFAVEQHLAIRVAPLRETTTPLHERMLAAGEANRGRHRDVRSMLASPGS